MIPGKPEIVDPASELTAGVPNKVQKQKMEGSFECISGPAWPPMELEDEVSILCPGRDLCVRGKLPCRDP